LGTQNQDFQKIQISSLEQFRPPPHKNGSKPNFSLYLFLRKVKSKNGQNRPKMAFFTSFHALKKIGKLLEQEGNGQFAVISLSVGKLSEQFAVSKRLLLAADTNLTQH